MNTAEEPRIAAARWAAAAGICLLAGLAAYGMTALPLHLAGIEPARALIPAYRSDGRGWEALYGLAGFTLTAAVIVYAVMAFLQPERTVLAGNRSLPQIELARKTGGGPASGMLIPFGVALGGLFAAMSAQMLGLVTAAAGGLLESLAPTAMVMLTVEYGMLGCAVFGLAVRELRRLLHADADSAGHGMSGEALYPAFTAAAAEGEANRPARSADHYDTLAAELRLALDLQQRWQPPIDLQLGAYRVTGRNRQDRDVGGDLFDAAIADDTTFAVLIGDVSGKGMPAAVMVPALHVLFRSELKRGGGPAEMLERMNRLLCDTAPENGVTLGVGIFNAATGEMRYASAGHPSPYLLKQGAAPTMLDSSSLPLGMEPEARYEEIAVRLAPGERLLLYTDGIVEATDSSGRMFGFEGLEQQLFGWEANYPADGWMEDVFGKLSEQYDNRKDDRTILAVERIVQSARPVLLHEMTWRIPSVPGCEKQVLAELADLIEEAWPEAGRKDDMLTCVAEAVMNAAEHGNGFDSERNVVVHAHFGNMLMVCRVSDDGGGFDVQRVQAEAHAARLSAEADAEAEACTLPDREHEEGRGWGMLLIDGLTDYWIATRDERGFCVELFFIASQRNG
jgi:phosphoserine phosphatase RsbU/P